MKIALFGIGNTGQNFIKNTLDYENDSIVAIFDNNPKLWGKKIDGNYSVNPPDEIDKYAFDYIIITSIYKDEIERQLLLYCDEDSIITIEDYNRMKYVRNVFREHNPNGFKKSINMSNTKIVVYTAITGGYDTLNEPLKKVDGIDYICFTNNRNLKSNDWEIRIVTDEELSDMYLAKKIKLFPNQYLSEYETSIWVDGKFQVIGDMKKYIEVYQQEKPMICFPHFERKCIYEEAAICISYGLGVKEDIIRQISQYERENYPFDNGLYEMGCIVRRHNDEIIIGLMNDWWNEILNFSYRDQISFPYVCWKNGFIPDICDLNLYKNKWLSCKRRYSKSFGDMR